MTHPLLAFMLTPMAAPETLQLRRMRRRWIMLCILVAASVTTNPLLTGLLGAKAALLPLVLCITSVIHGLRYFTAKTRADTAHMMDAAP